MRPVRFLQPYVYFTLADPALPVSPTYVAADTPYRGSLKLNQWLDNAHFLKHKGRSNAWFLNNDLKKFNRLLFPRTDEYIYSQMNTYETHANPFVWLCLAQYARKLGSICITLLFISKRYTVGLPGSCSLANGTNIILNQKEFAEEDSINEEHVQAWTIKLINNTSLMSIGTHLVHTSRCW